LNLTSSPATSIRNRDLSVGTSDMVAAQAAFGRVARLHVIRHLYLNGSETRSEIVEGTRISHGLVGQCLNKLKSLGVVVEDATPDNPPGDRTYALDRERTDHLLRTLTAFITDEGG
jgi:DNA-binding HxlR family transcriptional regulator